MLTASVHTEKGKTMGICTNCNHYLVCHYYDKNAEECNHFQNKTKWIPVTERLPEENGYYLCVVCVSAVNQRKEYRRKILFWEDNVWIEMENCFRTQKALYWMPLPEPPKGERREKNG